MNVTQPISGKILKRLRSKKGSPVTTRALLDLGTRSAVDQALSRLVKQGVIRRVSRGVYELPRVGRLPKKPVEPSPDDLVRACARNNGLRVVPSGAYAANLLGLSTQVPAKIVYYTNGRTQTLELGPYTIRMLNRGPKTMDVRGHMAPLVLQALRHIGRNRIAPRVIQRLRSILSPKHKSELRNNLRYAVAWMQLVIEDIAGGEPN